MTRAWSWLALLFLPLAPDAVAAPAAGHSQYGEEVFEKVGFDQHLGAALPLELPFNDERGASGALGRHFGARPVVLVLAYYGCPNLCSAVLQASTRALGQSGLQAGSDYEAVVVSIDPGERPGLAAHRKAAYLAGFGDADAAGGWHFLTGDAAAIERLAERVGFRYVYDSRLDQYAHPAGIVVATPEGRIARYLFGVQFNPRDLRLALVEAADGGIGNPVDRLLLLCYGYDPDTGGYGLLVMNVLRAGGTATALLIAGAILLMTRREKRRKG